jgi:hypothetical protein
MLLLVQSASVPSRAEMANQESKAPTVAVPSTENAEKKKPDDKPAGASPEASHDLLQLLKTAGSKKSNAAK